MNSLIKTCHIISTLIMHVHFLQPRDIISHLLKHWKHPLASIIMNIVDQCRGTFNVLEMKFCGYVWIIEFNWKNAYFQRHYTRCSFSQVCYLLRHLWIDFKFPPRLNFGIKIDFVLTTLQRTTIQASISLRDCVQLGEALLFVGNIALVAKWFGGHSQKSG